MLVIAITLCLWSHLICIFKLGNILWGKKFKKIELYRLSLTSIQVFQTLKKVGRGMWKRNKIMSPRNVIGRFSHGITTFRDSDGQMAVLQESGWKSPCRKVCWNSMDMKEQSSKCQFHFAAINPMLQSNKNFQPLYFFPCITWPSSRASQTAPQKDLRMGLFSWLCYHNLWHKFLFSLTLPQSNIKLLCYGGRSLVSLN